MAFLQVISLISILIFSSTTNNLIYTNSFTPSNVNNYPRTSLHDLIVHQEKNQRWRAAAQDNAESEAAKLLSYAKQIRAEAQAAEDQLHSSLIDKKSSHDKEMDAAIDKIFLPLSVSERDNDNKEGKELLLISDVAQRLREIHYSTDKLKEIVIRLHERGVSARGLKHVESRKSSGSQRVVFEVVSSPNQMEFEKIQGLTDRLIAAAELLDKEFLEENTIRGEKVKLHQTERVTWTKGQLCSKLKEKANFLEREHSDQFKNRQKEYYDAAVKKDKPKKKW